MRYRMMATYRGVLYEAGVGPTDKDVVLFAACPPPEELGFQPATGHWRKAVSRAEVDAVWESRPSGSFGGEPCLVLDDLGEHLHISYLGHDLTQAERLGYSQIEPGVFELLVAREDVTGITETRVDHPFLPLPYRGPDAEPGAPLPYPGPDAEPGTPLPYPGPDAEPGAPLSCAGPDGGPDTAAGSPLPAAVGLIPEAAPPGPALPPAVQPGVAALIPPQSTRQSRAAGRPPRAQTRQIFAELADLAAIPRDAYAVDEAVDGAICLVGTDSGFEVFSAADGVKQEVRLFYDEEAAYFYLFGLLAAEAVRDGRLAPPA